MFMILFIGMCMKGKMIAIKSRSLVTWGLGCAELTINSYEDASYSDGLCSILIVMVVSQLWTIVKMHQTIHLKL